MGNEADALEERTYNKGEVLCKQGEKTRHLYFLREGTVELQARNDETGEEAILAEIVGPAVIGTMAFLAGEPRTATVIARSPLICLIVADKQREKMMKSLAPWFTILFKDMTNNIRRANQLIAALKNAKEKLEKRIKQRDTRIAELESALKSKNDPAAAARERASGMNTVASQK